ncbi:MAG: toll/interleukin-1 receptor domain-containing protein [Leptolyngbyaceae cyanobacterium RM2_2_4]|nr:toll/interleukin-1 receptor domain-containing protein [Leptolyngbyaceae cyanobacterium SL_5_14]NJO51220.1 toll/interleukin-1 receptor domain-containing protein [Leptolyngbyaceae cyanobacterium RM2_2_4]
MTNLSSIEKRKLEKLFEMGNGYVLDFTNKTFQEFVFESVDVDIYDSKYEYGSGSKANRLRAIWDREPRHIVGKLISDLLEHWRTQRLLNSKDISQIEQALFDECFKISQKLKQNFETEYNDSETELLSKNGVSLFEKEIFISYAWGGESEEFVNRLDRAFQAKGITIIRDKRNLGYKGDIKEFMEGIGRGKCIVVIISDRYLRSSNCMFELTQIAKNGDIYGRTFPIVLADAQIYKPTQRIDYVKYWESEIKELDEAIRGVSAANLQGFREDIDQYTEIRRTISEITNILKNMNTLTPEAHSKESFETLFQTIENKLLE